MRVRIPLIKPEEDEAAAEEQEAKSPLLQRSRSSNEVADFPAIQISISGKTEAAAS